MLILPAATAELPEIAALVNSAYRGESSRTGWTTEADFLGGQRTDPQTLARDLAANDDAVILTLRDDAPGPLLACVWLEPAEAGAWYLGMLSVAPDQQDRRLGRRLMEAAEAYAAERGAGRMRMTVISIRAELIAWYERRGYRRTGETAPFPADDPLFGIPLRDDLSFVVLEKPMACTPQDGAR
jgi:ribosomal protein S18 acetylase RimI-like enzyme